MPEWSQTSSKLDEAMALLDEAIDGGHRVLVFSQFVDLLSLLRSRIEQRHGTTAIWMGLLGQVPSGVHPAFSP